MEKEIIKYSHIHEVAYSERDIATVFPPHWHNSAEFTLIMKEGCRFKIGDKIYEPDAGDIILVWPTELHEILYAPEEGYIFIQFSSSLIENNTDIATAIRVLSRCHHLNKDNKICPEIKDCFNEFIRLYSSNEHFIETKCKNVVYKLLLIIGEYVMQEYKDLMGSENFSNTGWGYIRTACSYISSHYSDDISQSDVASVVGLSPYYFSKIFKEYTHMTFPTYLANIRVQRAISLLAETNHSITDCAFMSGFQSTTTFNKAFREYTGCSPREFKKMHSL